MKIHQLKESLGLLEQMLSGMGAGVAAKDIEKLTELFEGHENLTVSVFVTKAKKGLQKKTSSARSGNTPKLKDDLISSYLDDLKGAEESSDDFFEVLSRLGKDRKARKVEAIAIAQKRLATKTTFKSKKEAVEAIKTDYVTNSHHQTNKSMLEKMGWN